MMARYSCYGSHKEIGEDVQNRQKKVDRELKKQQAPQSLDFGGLVLFFPEKRRYFSFRRTFTAFYDRYSCPVNHPAAIHLQCHKRSTRNIVYNMITVK